MGTAVVLVVLLLGVGMAVKSMIRDKKNGKSLQCGGDCKHCGRLPLVLVKRARIRKISRIRALFLFYILKRCKALFSSTNFYYLFYLVDKYFAVTDVTSVKGFLCGVYHFVHRKF